MSSALISQKLPILSFSASISHLDRPNYANPQGVSPFTLQSQQKSAASIMMEMQQEKNDKIFRLESFGKRTTAGPQTPRPSYNDSSSIFSMSDTPTPAFAEVDSDPRSIRWNNVDAYLEQINELGYDIEVISQRSAFLEQDKPAPTTVPFSIYQQQLDITNNLRAKIDRTRKSMRNLKGLLAEFREQVLRLRRFIGFSSSALKDQFQQQQEKTIVSLSLVSKNIQAYRQSELQHLEEQWRANEEKFQQERERERKDWDEKVFEMQTEIKWLRKELVKTERQAAELAEENQSLKQSQLELEGTKSQAEELLQAHEKQAAYVMDLEERISVLQTKADPEHRAIIEQYYREQFELAKAQLRHLITLELKEEMKIDLLWIEKLKKEREEMERHFSEEIYKIEDDNRRLREEYRKMDSRNGQLEVRLLELEMKVKDLSQREALIELKYESLQQENQKMKEELMREIQSLAKTVQSQSFTPITTATAHTPSFVPSVPSLPTAPSSPIIISQPYRISSVKPYQPSVQSILTKLNQKYRLPSSAPKRIYHPSLQKLRDERMEDRKRLQKVGEKLAKMHDNFRMELLLND